MFKIGSIVQLDENKISSDKKMQLDFDIFYEVKNIYEYDENYFRIDSLFEDGIKYYKTRICKFKLAEFQIGCKVRCVHDFEDSKLFPIKDKVYTVTSYFNGTPKISYTDGLGTTLLFCIDNKKFSKIEDSNISNTFKHAPYMPIFKSGHNFDVGDVVKVISDSYKKINHENVNFKNMQGVVTDFGYIYITIDVNGLLHELNSENLELIEKNVNSQIDSKYFQQEYEDIDGVILKDQNEPVNLIPKYFRGDN